MKSFLAGLAVLAMMVSTVDANGFVGFANNSSVRVVNNPPGLFNRSVTDVRVRGNAAAAVNVNSFGFNNAAAINVANFSRNRANIAVFNGALPVTTFNGVRVNAFGTGTVVDGFGNVFEVDAFGNSVLRSNAAFRGFNTFSNTGFSSLTVQSVPLSVPFGVPLGVHSCGSAILPSSTILNFNARSCRRCF